MALKILQIYIEECHSWNFERIFLEIIIKKFSTDSCAIILSLKAKCNGKFDSNYYKYYYSNKRGISLVQSNQIFLPFGNFLSKNLEIGVLKRVRTPLKGVLKECHSIFNGGVGAGVPLNLLAVSGSGSATQKIKEC